MAKINTEKGKVAIVGSRCLHVSIEDFVAPSVSHIITGGALGVDTDAIDFARKYKIPITIVRPNYDEFGNIAPIIRNKKIVELCNSFIAVWDGHSKGTKSAINFAVKSKKPVTVFIVEDKHITKHYYNTSEQVRLFNIF